MDNSTAAAIRARNLLTTVARKQREATDISLGEYGVVTSVSGSLVAVQLNRDTAAPTQLLARAAGPAIVVGDPVTLLPMRGGGFVALKIGGDETYSETGINAPVTPVSPGRRINWLNVLPLGALANITVTANRLYYLAIYVTRSVTATALEFNVTTAVAGNVMLGIYNISTGFNPAGLYVSTAKTAVSTVGVKSLAVSYSLTGGRWYAIAFVSDVAMGISGLNAVGSFPAIKGGASVSDGTSWQALTYEALTAGWTSLPADASPSNINNIYLHLSIAL